MKTGYRILSVASILPLLSSCGAFQTTAESDVLSINPVFNVRHSNQTPESLYQLGRYYQGQKRLEQAQAAYRKALDIDDKYTEAHTGLGVIYSMQGRQQEALEQFRLAAKLAPNDAHIYNNLGYALYLNKAYAEAATVLDRAVTLDPSNQTAHTNLALALDKAGDKGKAVQVMARAENLQVNEDVPPLTQETQQAQTAASTPAPVSAQTVAPTSIPAPTPQQALALPKDWGVITQAVPKPVTQVESRVQAVQLAPNVFELRERAEAQVQAAPLQTASAAKPIQPASAAKPPQTTSAAKPLQPASAAKPIQTASATKPIQTASAQPQERAAAPAAKTYRIEVSNGNGVTGMARKVATFLDGKGYSGARLTNQKPFQVTMSQVQYRSGYRDQALSLASTLPGPPGMAQSEAMRADISVRVVLGKDVAGNVAYFEKNQDKIRLVRN